MPERSLSESRSSLHKPLLIVLSGPSGVGKDAVLARMKELKLPLHYVVTLTTRSQRPAEKDGVDYRFVFETDFEKLRERRQLLECANVYGNWYGVPRDDVERAFESGLDTIVKVDVQGAENIKRLMPQAVSIFLAPPAKDDLLARLDKRKTESSVEMDTRLKAAEGELEKMHLFDYVVVNEWGMIDAAVSDIRRIICAEKCQPEISEKH